MEKTFCVPIREYVNSYFKNNEESLKKYYPGISKECINNELQNYLLNHVPSEKDKLESVYFPYTTNETTQFFKSLDLGIPFAYISGRTYFYKSEFIITPDVLIPRNETETLVEMCVSELNKIKENKNSMINIADIGIGSGVIALSILMDVDFPIKAIGIDIVDSALEVASRNYYNLRYQIPEESSLDLIKSDRLSKVTEKMDLIVSNPPYIKIKSDLAFVHPQVLLHEPEIALFLSDNEYEKWFYDFFKQVYSSLNSGGVFLMEGHESHLCDLAKLIETFGFSQIEINKDLTGRDRFLVARKREYNG